MDEGVEVVTADKAAKLKPELERTRTTEIDTDNNLRDNAECGLPEQRIYNGTR